MEVVKRADVPQVELRTERVPVEALGGDVVVRGRLLAQKLSLAAMRQRVLEPMVGESPAETEARAGAEIAAHTLAAQVLADDGEPLFTAAQWSIWGATHTNELIQLHEVCERLSGANEEAVAKN